MVCHHLADSNLIGASISWNGLRDRYENEIKFLKHLYATHYAERAFHDRELCEYISYMLVSLFDHQGFPELDADGTLAVAKVRRSRWPSWVLSTLRSRERNRCATCPNSISELEGEFHVDHIVPLSQGGCNDIVNLQLLCSSCNLSKAANLEKVSSSIPKYFAWHKSMERHLETSS